MGCQWFSRKDGVLLIMTDKMKITDTLEACEKPRQTNELSMTHLEVFDDLEHFVISFDFIDVLSQVHHVILCLLYF